MNDLRKRFLKIKTETTYGTNAALTLVRRVNAIGKPFAPLSHEVRMLTIEGRVNLTRHGVQRAVRFLRTTADQLEGLVGIGGTRRKQRKT